MEVLPRNLIGNSCRLCDSNSEPLVNIFDKRHDGQQIIHMIRQCLPLIIYRSDPLSKVVCQTCCTKLDTLCAFKLATLATAKKHKAFLAYSLPTKPSVQLYFSCEEDTIPVQKSYVHVTTSTDDIPPSDICRKCDQSMAASTHTDYRQFNKLRSALLYASRSRTTANAGKWHRYQATTTTTTTTTTATATPNSQRNSQILQHSHHRDSDHSDQFDDVSEDVSQSCSDMELEDCSNTTSVVNCAKRRRIESPIEAEEEEEVDDDDDDDDDNDKVEEVEPVVDLIAVAAVISQETEVRYCPLKLFALTLNTINATNLGGYVARDCCYWRADRFQPVCRYCAKQCANSKMLALHEIEHMSVVVGDRVDYVELWPVDRADADIRNKWMLTTIEGKDLDDTVVARCRLEEDEDEETADSASHVNNTDAEDVDMMESEDNDDCTEDTSSLDVDVDNRSQNGSGSGEIGFVGGEPSVDGRPLSSYTKIDRRTFYKSVRIGGVIKKFCSLCRYIFKDNWAIEAHYFSGSCFYTCRYCGVRFTKLRNRFEEHVRMHATNGEVISNRIFAGKLNALHPRIIQPDKVERISTLITTATTAPSNGRLVKVKPPLPPLLPATFVKHERPDSDSEFAQSVMTTDDNDTNEKRSGPNQAYFCRKCYKVFFKLDEFNVHSKDCDYNQTPTVKNVKVAAKSGTEEVLMSPSGRPIRHCVREVGAYRDELYFTPSGESAVAAALPLGVKSNCLCQICNITFPTVYSRNSHMRIHKGEHVAKKTASPPAHFRTRNSQMAAVTNVLYSARRRDSMSEVKQEPLDFEPEVEIHETESKFNSSLLGSVSITPISKDPTRKAVINPNIMKLVQNNPHLTIKTNADESNERFSNSSYSSCNNANNYSDSNGSDNGDKMYKCSSCFQSFANKSNLYFHKKHKCDGSKYPCPFCKKRFGTESAYSSHIFYSHPE